MSELEIDYGDGGADSDQDERISLGGFDDSTADLAPLEQVNALAAEPSGSLVASTVDTGSSAAVTAPEAHATKPTLGLVGNTDWIAKESKSFGGIYYANVKTNETLWEKPKEVEEYEQSLELAGPASAEPVVEPPLVADGLDKAAAPRRSADAEDYRPRREDRRDDRALSPRGDRRDNYRSDRGRGPPRDRDGRGGGSDRYDERNGRSRDEYDRRRGPPLPPKAADTLNTRTVSETYRPEPRRLPSPGPGPRGRPRSPPPRQDRRRSPPPRDRRPPAQQQTWAADSYKPSRPAVSPPPRDREPVDNRGPGRSRQGEPLSPARRDRGGRYGDDPSTRRPVTPPPARVRSRSPVPRQADRDLTPRYDSHGQRESRPTEQRSNQSTVARRDYPSERDERKREQETRSQQDPPPPLPADPIAASAYTNMRRGKSDHDRPPAPVEKRSEAEKRAELHRRLELERERQHSPPPSSRAAAPVDDDRPSGMMVNPARMQAVQRAEEEARRQRGAEPASVAVPRAAPAVVNRGNQNAPVDAPTGPRSLKVQTNALPTGPRKMTGSAHPSARPNDFATPTSAASQSNRPFIPPNSAFGRGPETGRTPSSAQSQSGGLPTGPRRQSTTGGYDSYRPDQSRPRQDNGEYRSPARGNEPRDFRPSEADRGQYQQQDARRGEPRSPLRREDDRPRPRQSDSMQVDERPSRPDESRHRQEEPIRDGDLSESRLLRPQEPVESRTRPREDEAASAETATNGDRPVKRRREEQPDAIVIDAAEPSQSLSSTSRDQTTQAQVIRVGSQTPPLPSAVAASQRSPGSPPLPPSAGASASLLSRLGEPVAQGRSVRGAAGRAAPSQGKKADAPVRNGELVTENGIDPQQSPVDNDDEPIDVDAAQGGAAGGPRKRRNRRRGR